MSMPETMARAVHSAQSFYIVPQPGSDISTVLRAKKSTLVLKRIYDVIFSATGLFVLMPVFLVIAVLIKLDSPGPVFYTQARVGKDRKWFKIYKFRKMHANVGNRGSKLTLADDQRLTRIGSFLRKTKMDELPQAWNVLKGDMAVVGPRPETPNYVRYYNQEHYDVLKVRPGITDYASIYFIDEGSLFQKVADPETYYVETIMPQKIQMNMMYIRDMSFTTDMKIIFLTFKNIVHSIRRG